MWISAGSFLSGCSQNTKPAELAPIQPDSLETLQKGSTNRIHRRSNIQNLRGLIGNRYSMLQHWTLRPGHGLCLSTFLTAVVFLAACTSTPPTASATSAIVDKDTTCPSDRRDNGTRIIWTDSRSEAEIWQGMCGPIIPTTTATPTTRAPTTTTTVPTPTTTAPTTITIVVKTTVCPENRARGGQTITWEDDRTERLIWADRA